MRSKHSLFRALAGLLTVAFTASAVPAVCALAQVECCEAEETEQAVEMSCCDEDNPEPIPGESPIPAQSACACSDAVTPATVAPEINNVASIFPEERQLNLCASSLIALDSLCEAPRGHGPPLFLLDCCFLI